MSRANAENADASTSELLLTHHLIWALGSLCQLHRLPFDAQLLRQQFPPPSCTETLRAAAAALGFSIRRTTRASCAISAAMLPCLALSQITPLAEDGKTGESHIVPDLIVDVSADKVGYFPAGTSSLVHVSHQEFSRRFTGGLFLLAPMETRLLDPDAVAGKALFGFRWFWPELLKHRGLWREVLLASLVLQLLALGMPLFSQVIIDKVIVHRSVSTLLVMAMGLLLFMLFSALLSWARQSLLLHMGNRIDAVLAMAVFKHLFCLSPRYFEQRPTGVIAARLHAVETIREFLASAAVSLLLDLPLSVVFIAVMFCYSAPLSLIALAVLCVIAVISVVVAPLFQAQLNQQFLLGARNQAFMTEYIAGIETVKSLQMEPQLYQRFSGYLSDYLHATFKTRQLANLYNTLSGSLEQLLKLLILLVGAYIAMHSTTFTIGMLVAYQMFAGNLSGPVMRIVSLWQQFQQADLSVRRLGDIMDAPAEPYSVMPVRTTPQQGKIEIDSLGFRYSEQHPWLYRELNVQIEPGSTVAIMGPSGSGKSTLAKLLQGFYPASEGRILIDGADVQHLAANVLRSYFGVVPQETVLFSGTLYDNLRAANPYAGLEQIVNACVMAEIHDSIEQLPGGYQTVIGERGCGLSGGQRQRLAIARALLKNPQVLIFDEATSALDTETAQQFAATINRIRGRVSMLFITHALPANLKPDQILNLGQVKGLSPQGQNQSTPLS